MNKIFFQNGEFVAGKGVHTYQKILDDFLNTSFIGILTFNITPYEDSELLNRLKAACEKGAEVVVITNIPKRWSRYKSVYNVNDAKKAITDYVRTLDPKKFDYRLSAYFDFDNHAKIIITDNLVYCGSENFSDTSKNNYECGFISDDKNIISHIRNNLFSKIKTQAISYYNYDCATAIVFLSEASSYCKRSKELVYEAAYEPWEDYDTNFNTIWIYRGSNSDISAQLLSGIIEGFGQYESALSVISEIVDSYYEKYDEPSEEIERLEQIYEEYNDSFKIMMQELEKLFEDIDQLAHYDYDYEVNSIINNDYGLESFDENLEYYVGLAIGEASADYESLIEDAEPTVKSILDKFDDMIDFYDKMQNTIKLMLKVNSNIDNT